MSQPSTDLLLVEDDPETRDATIDVLQAVGYRVQSAVDGRDALAWLAANESPRLIILDLMMPVMNGWQFRSAQLANPAIAAIPVMLVSAGQSLEHDAKELRAAAAVAKPVDLGVMLDKIRALVGG